MSPEGGTGAKRSAASLKKSEDGLESARLTNETKKKARPAPGFLLCGRRESVSCPVLVEKSGRADERASRVSDVVGDQQRARAIHCQADRPSPCVDCSHQEACDAFVPGRSDFRADGTKTTL